MFQLSAISTLLTDLKATEEATHASRAIQRNADGIASILMHNQAGAVTGKCLVDDEDWQAAERCSWHLESQGYPATNTNGTKLRMHKFLKSDAPMQDHISRDKLDNRRSNLRDTTTGANSQNASKRANASSQYWGVGWQSKGRVWFASIKKDKITYWLCSFLNEEGAARAYDDKAVQLYAHPRLNFPTPLRKLS
jgi:hypothetical protein